MGASVRSLSPLAPLAAGALAVIVIAASVAGAVGCGSSEVEVGPAPAPGASGGPAGAVEGAGGRADGDADAPVAKAAPVLSRLPNPDGTWGVAIGNVGKASVEAKRPLRIDSYFFGTPTVSAAGYQSLTAIDGGLRGTGTVSPWPGVSFDVTDTWVVSGDAVTTRRALTVSGSRPFDRFMDAIVMTSVTKASRDDVDYFVPGFVHGRTTNVKADCIGGADTYGPGHGGVLRIREDRLPAPLFGLHFDDGAAVTLLDPSPRADTVQADSDDVTGEVWDRRMTFGALGAEQTRSPTSDVTLGYWFPGSEGEVTYDRITTMDWLVRQEDGGRHKWKLRLHPIEDGLRHDYTVTWRFSIAEDFAAYRKNAWRHAWRELGVNQNVVVHDIDQVRRVLTDFIASRVATESGHSGLLSAIDIKTGDPLLLGIDKRAYLGFIGKNLENAEHLLREAQRRGPSDAARLRAAAHAIIGTFVAIDQSPPSAEGVKMDAMSAGSATYYPTDTVCFLRPFTDDMAALLRAYQFEKKHGREHATWLAHVRDFAEWLLGQQGADGSFPRSWNAGVGTVSDASKNMSGLAVPLLLGMHRATGVAAYETAALRAGEASWQTFLANDRHFVGATPDRPNVLVHEASALAIGTYADLYEATRDAKWLERAKVAADVNETWYVLWNVPAPLDANDADLSVKRQVSSVGMDLCTSTNSGVDYYNANDVDSYARLYAWTGDAHYLDVARLLMHNTKSMIALPGRGFDLSGPGMQQEFWFLGPPRRQSWIREYTPWVTANQLHGIFLTEELGPALYGMIAGP